MKRLMVLFILLVSISLVSFAKDIHAWKSEANLEQQFLVFKKNLNYWNGSYFMEPLQINQLYGALTDSLAVLEKVVVDNQAQIVLLQNKLRTNKAQTVEISEKLDESIKRENSFALFGMNINKNVYSVSMYFIILGVLVLAGIMFLMYKRSNSITVSSKKDYLELKDEFELHKKNALERYVQMNKELHKARMELKNR